MTATIEIRAPSEQTEGTRSQVQRWLKSVGDVVVENEPLIELETDKVTIEIPAPAGGVLAEIFKQEQDEIAPGELLGRIQAGAESQVGVKAVSAPAQAAAQAGPVDDVTTATLSAHAAALSGGRNSPAVRRLLSEHKLHAADIRGSGAGGRITVDDVLEHVARQQPSSPAAREPAPAVQPGAHVRHVPHSSVRKRIAERMVESLLHTAPHVTTIFEVDLGAVLAHRAIHRADFEQRGASLTLTAYFLAACVDAIREVPEANSRWTDDALEIHETIDIGVGTAVEGKGLVVPVVRGVQSLDLFGIARALSDLVARAREDKLTPADVRGGTFTISNHGVSGSLVATPIVINQPQSAILGVGKLEKRAVVVDANGADAIVVRPRCYVTLTLDHRVMDGHRANRFLQVLAERLENWKDRKSG
jgi:2-oxoglutarate dehydrogenase E2 component (dihydrolipoamide succinyltransferase)